MTTFRKILRSPVTSIALFAVAAVMLLTSVIGGARAALTIESDFYTAQVEMYEIGVTLNENGQPVSSRDFDVENNASDTEAYWKKTQGALCEKLYDPAERDLAEADRTPVTTENFKLGTKYDEAISVTNSGLIDEYVRVSVHKYWAREEDGELVKHPELDPKFIELNFVTGQGWTIDEAASTDEMTVLYYNSIFPSGQTSSPLTDTLMINEKVMTVDKRVEPTTWTEDGVTYTNYKITYTYDGAVFVIDEEVDAVQTHNAEDAIRSAWGRDVTISGNSLTLN